MFYLIVNIHFLHLPNNNFAIELEEIDKVSIVEYLELSDVIQNDCSLLILIYI